MKYKIITNKLIHDIQTGLFKKGDRIPSIREMALEYRVNKSTVIRAYEELEERHIIYSVAKSGYYVTDGNINRNKSNEIMDFSKVAPDQKTLPFREFNHCINRAVDIYKNKLFNYGNTQGLESLRYALAGNLATNDVYAKPENICVTSGAHQGINILLNMKFPSNKKKILIEQPTYSEIYNMLEISGNEFTTINRDENGLDLDEIERIFKDEDIKFFYTMPKFHNPLGANLPEIQKKRLVELASKYNVYIVEDDYLCDIEVNNLCLPMHYYDVDNMVIYVRSFSKSFMPGIRMGCVVLNKELIDEFVKVKRSYDLNTSILMQGALELYITNGMYKSHIKKINKAYKNKYNALMEQLNSLDKERKYINPEYNSLIFWVNLNGKINSTIMCAKLLEKGVKVAEGEQYFAKKAKLNNVRLCIAPLSCHQIRQGINIIYDEIRKLHL